MTERDAYIALNMVKGLGVVTLRNAVHVLGSAKRVFCSNSEELAQIKGIGVARAEMIVEEIRKVDWEKEKEFAEKKSVNLITIIDDEYPELLKKISSPPSVLYVLGDTEAINVPSVGIVGTRNPSLYGRAMAKKFSYGLAQRGVCVVSGLALGIDTEAHSGALLGKGRTTAVVGSALDCLYPKDNTELARNVIRSGGAVVSEYPFGVSGNRYTFPMRNRIISGLSRGVLVVEAALNSGSLITAEQAMEQNRPVMAIPGRLDSELSAGTNRLIADGARLVETVDDVLEEMEGMRLTCIEQPIVMSNPIKNEKSTTRIDKKCAPHFEKPKPKLDEIEQKLLEALGSEEMTADALIACSGVSPSQIGARLISLEMKGLINRYPGNVLKAKGSTI
jgi:DNA processing protein